MASSDEEAKHAIAIVQELTATPELDKTYLGRVERITDFGAFVDVMPDVDGLLHVSENPGASTHRVRRHYPPLGQVTCNADVVTPHAPVVAAVR